MTKHVRAEKWNQVVLSVFHLFGFPDDETKASVIQWGELRAVPQLSMTRLPSSKIGFRKFQTFYFTPVMPMVLKELIQHDVVTTTGKYYPDISARETG